MLDVRAGDFRDGHDVVGHGWLGNERLQLREVDDDFVVVLGVVVGLDFLVDVLAVEPGEVVLRVLVGREDRGGGTEFGAHVGDGRPLGNRQRLDAGAGVFEHLADAAFDGETAEQLENDVLGGGPVRQLAFETDVDDLGHLDVVRAAAHGDGDVETTGADGEFAQAAGGRRVGVRAEHGLAGRGEVLLVDVVTDTVARAREVRTERTGGRAQEAVVVGVLEVELVGLVVTVLGGQFRLDLFETERLELQPDERAGRVLCEHLVDLDTDFLSGCQLPFDEVVVENLFRERLSHNVRQSTVRAYKSIVFVQRVRFKVTA